ncbi:hypothetical protein GCM10020258_18930 [Sphingomonas yabuuchiae]
MPLLIVADGGALTFIDYSVKQVQRWPIKNSPLGVLLDPSRDIGRYAKVVPSADPRLLSVEANDPKHPEYGKITLVFARDAAAPGGLMMQGWVALDSQNNRTTIACPTSVSACRWTTRRSDLTIPGGRRRVTERRRTVSFIRATGSPPYQGVAVEGPSRFPLLLGRAPSSRLRDER